MSAEPNAPREVSAVGDAVVVGSGTMGRGIAIACVDAGVRVVLVDNDGAALERARGAIERHYAAACTKGRIDEATRAARLARCSYGDALDAADRVDLVIEAAFEELGVKQAIFRELDRIARPGTILASNTSTLDIDAIAAATARPADVVGLHFFSPANVMKLLEIVRGSQTSAATIRSARALAVQLGKIGVVAGNCDGFIGNRMLAPYRRQADFLLEEGGTPSSIDAALKGFGFAMGPFAVSDLAGLDIGWSIRKRRNAAHAPVGRYSHIADWLCERGRFGQKTGAGYYRYEPGDRTPQPDALVETLVTQAARKAGIVRRSIDDAEIVQRCVYALVNEAAAILSEGIAASAADIDTVWVNGYGFPAARGGPLAYADSVGLATVVDDMRALATVHGDTWTPAPLLVELAVSGRTFGHRA